MAKKDKVFSLFDFCKSADKLQVFDEHTLDDEESKKVFWDNYSVLKTAEMKGVQKEKAETVRRMQAKGFSIEDISEVVELTR